MSYDALMRWEWEGGYPAFVNEWDEAPDAEPAENDTLTQPRARVATPSKSPPEGRQGDGCER
jgi:hypothetical protein